MSSRSEQDEREGRVLSMMLKMLTSGMSDPARLSRGRTYASQGAVIDLHVAAGELTGAVQGSRSMPYKVTAYVDRADAFDTRAALVPERRDIHFTCTCPDWDDPCKHAIAVMVTFADEVADDPALLVRWRGGESDQRAPRAIVGSRVGTTSAPPAAPDRNVLDPETRVALTDFLGTPNEIEFEPVARLRPPVAAWGELWAEMLADALNVLTTGDRLP